MARVAGITCSGNAFWWTQSKLRLSRRRDFALMGIGNQLIGDLEHRLTVDALRRQSLFRMTGASSHCWKAETEIQRMYPGMRCLLLPSATVGLSLLLEVLQLKHGGEVVIAPFGWLSNWSCIRRAGLIPRFLPLNDDLQLEVDEVAKRISDRTAAVIVTHLMGRGQQEIGRLAELCTRRGIPLLEDIAQSFGVSINGRRAGSFGLASWCSLNHHKLLSTGDGGFLLVGDEHMFAKLSALHDQGCVIKEGSRRHADIVEPGLSLRTNELMAAVLRAQLARFHLIRCRILRNHSALAEACAGNLNLDIIAPHEGDIPFTVLFRRPEGMEYPSLANSGWHVAPNVPWMAAMFAESMSEDQALADTIEKLTATSALGAAFVDPYYAIPLGLTITDSVTELPRVTGALRDML